MADTYDPRSTTTATPPPKAEGGASSTASTAIVATGGQASAPAEIVRMNFSTVQGFEALQRAARLLAASRLMPQAYQGNLPDCALLLNMADRLRADPLMVAQALSFIHGKPAWSSAFLIASVNSCGRFESLEFEYIGERGSDGRGCYCVTTDKRTKKRLEGTLITIAMAKAEGWYGRKDSKWPNMPEQMLGYRAAAFWTRLYAPEIAAGLRTREEVVDAVLDEPEEAAPPSALPAPAITVTASPPKKKRGTAALKEQVAAAAAVLTAPEPPHGEEAPPEPEPDRREVELIDEVEGTTSTLR